MTEQRRAVLVDIEIKRNRRGQRYATASLDEYAAFTNIVIPASMYDAGLITEGTCVAVTTTETKDGSQFVSSIERIEPPPTWIGTCARCHGPSHRYGDGGHPLCSRCRGIPSCADLDRAGVPAIVEDPPAWADTDYPDESGGQA